MSSLPLFDTPSDADAWHNVQAPGGYERWYFDAEDSLANTQVVAVFGQGCLSDTNYRRAFDRFLKNPTRTTPPLPADYPSVSFSVYQAGRLAHQFVKQYRPADFSASRDKVDLRIGTSRLYSDAGAYRLTLSGTPQEPTWLGPKLLTDRTLSADFTFVPTFSHAPIERALSSREHDATHQWVLANAHCRVEGTIRIGNESIVFNGRGYRDHQYGTAPIAHGLSRIVRGRVMGDDELMTFHCHVPQDPAQPAQVHLLRINASGGEVLEGIVTETDWSKRSATGLEYPSHIAFGERLVLNNPQVLGATTSEVRLTYDARGLAAETRAICTVEHRR
ncbi:MAG: hypothetical protein H7144_02810 [Burkholderiales bacterium]|nr:hypothetical protein [Phycisphaerae bacterium]